MIDAINHTLREALEEDPKVVMFGKTLLTPREECTA